VSMMNHDCEPTAVVDYPHGNFTAEVRTLRECVPGEAVTISYDGSGLAVNARREALRRYGFECNCRKCASEGMSGLAKDATRTKEN